MTDPIPVKRPIVAREARPTSNVAVASVLLALGAGVFFWLAEARAAIEEGASALPPLATNAASPAPAPLAVAQAAPAAAASDGAYFIPNSGPVPLAPSRPPATTGYEGAAPQADAPGVIVDRMRERLRAPALIVDLAQAELPRLAGSARSDSGATVAAKSPAPVADAAPPVDRTLSDVERFSARVGDEEVQVAQAKRMTGLDRLVPQGAIIGAVMETALNSDLPGFARARTQRDVYSFDGSAVLIPAGSRLIGQYKSGVAQGASRVFVLWTRLIRPDGVSIELASPAVDDLGRAGIGGKVNRHFFQRFSGAILTSVLTGGLNALAASVAGGSTVIVSTAGQATSLASEQSLSTDIPPTITTRQGATVRIFVARDLDFTRVGPSP